MQEEIKLLEMDERRALVAAAKDVTDFRVSAVTTDFGIASNNLYSFLSLRGNSIGAATQVLVMRNYGFNACGSLMHYLHSWVVLNSDSFLNVKTCLSYEKDISDIEFVKVFTSLDSMEFVGGYFQFRSKSASKLRRLIVTLNNPTMKIEEFVSGMAEAFGVPFGKWMVGEDIRVSNSSAREVWRWKYGRGNYRKTPFRTPPKLSHLGYGFDFKSDEGVVESPESLLGQMIPRFERLSEENAKLKGHLKPSSWDSSLINRARKTLENI